MPPRNSTSDRLAAAERRAFERMSDEQLEALVASDPIGANKLNVTSLTDAQLERVLDGFDL
jgi:hypothetical protein